MLTSQSFDYYLKYHSSADLINQNYILFSAAKCNTDQWFDYKKISWLLLKPDGSTGLSMLCNLKDFVIVFNED